MTKSPLQQAYVEYNLAKERVLALRKEAEARKASGTTSPKAEVDANTSSKPPRLITVAATAPTELTPKLVHVAEKPIVVQFSADTDVPDPVKRTKRMSWTMISALLAIALPTFLALLYFTLVSTPRYATEVRFALRAQDAKMVDALGMLSALGGAATQLGSDSYIVVDYVQSRQFVEDLDAEVNLRAGYSASSIDYLSRFSPIGSKEDLLKYWRSMTSVYYDSIKNTVMLEVTAYDPDYAKRIAEASLKLVGKLVNRLSDEARADALSEAATEFRRMEERAKSIRAQMQAFREKERVTNPIGNAKSSQELIASLQGELAKLNAQIQTSRSLMSKTAPTVLLLESQRESLLAQIEAAKKHIDGIETTSNQGAIASMLSSYEELEVERQFSEQAYTAALASLERARTDAIRVRRYLAVFVSPLAAETALYPRVFRNLFLILLGCGMAWSIVVLSYYGIREHTV